MEIDVKKLGDELGQVMLDAVKSTARDMTSEIIQQVIAEVRKNATETLNARKATIIEKLSNEVETTSSLTVKIRNKIYLYLLNNTQFLDDMNNQLMASLEHNLNKISV